jgi:hypothetical protein
MGVSGQHHDLAALYPQYLLDRRLTNFLSPVPFKHLLHQQHFTCEKSLESISQMYRKLSVSKAVFFNIRRAYFSKLNSYIFRRKILYMEMELVPTCSSNGRLQAP